MKSIKEETCEDNTNEAYNNTALRWSEAENEESKQTNTPDDPPPIFEQFNSVLTR